MGKKEVTHHRNEHETHHQKSHHEVHQESKFSLFKHRIADVFKDMVEAPPEEKPAPKEEMKEETDTPIITAKVPVEEEIDEEELVQREKEKARDEQHEEIMQSLNQAVAKWKETGDVGEHLEPPVPLREKVKHFWSKMKFNTAVSEKLKNRVEEVFEKVSSRVKKAEHHGENVDTEKVIQEEWKSVFEKVESVSQPSEREEIEKLYKELSGK